MQVITLWPGLPEPATGLLKSDEMDEYLKTVDVAAATDRLKRKRLKEHNVTLKRECAAAVEKAYADGLCDLAAAASEFRSAKEKVGDDLHDLLQACLETVFRKCSVPDLVEDVIAPVLANLQDHEDLSIIVPADKVSDFEKAFKKCKDTHLGGLRVFIEPSESDDNDECTIYTGADVLDFSVSVMTERLMKTVADLAKPKRTRSKAASDE